MFIICSYCLSQTELFLNSLLDQGPVKTVVAPELPHSDHHRTPSKEREKVAVVHKSSQRDPPYEQKLLGHLVAIYRMGDFLRDVGVCLWGNFCHLIQKNVEVGGY